jgi:hypothetical protein
MTLRTPLNVHLTPGAEATPLHPPWWREPYVWLVISGPVSVMLACLITAVFIFRGPDAVVPESKYQQGKAIMNEVKTAAPPMLPAHTARNHSATGGGHHAER